MARTTVRRLGGSFAPPITAEKLQRYRDLAQSATPQVRDIMLRLCDMAAKFQETGPSQQQGIMHPSGMALMIPLEQAEIDRIDDVVPWTEECETFQRVFDDIQADVRSRNSKRLEEWHSAVRASVYAKHFPGEEMSKYGQKRYLMRLYDRDVRNRPLIKRIMMSLGFFEEEREDILRTAAQGLRAKSAQMAREVDSITKGRADSPVPKPELESEELRNGAMHLLWYAKELAADREPPTNDKLILRGENN